MRTKLLIVDDEPAIVDVVQTMISGFDFETRVAYDGIQAISVAKSFHPDCVVTGIMMPNMDGFEEVREILSFLPNCKFILMSGNANRQEVRDAHGAMGFDPKFLLQKPFSPAEIASALKLAGFACLART
ncbi:MAG TPA: response regulator [Nitrospira sp.]|nr:response regulator [Nitrospira sp.]